ncbi:MAG: transcriptional regulator [Propionibacteriales bacterium]|nr:transcriptional regulator [Propionibacteriales bacterium]
MTRRPELGDQLDKVAGLAEAQRRALYGHIASQAEPVSRDEAANAVGISRTLAAYHLDRLARDGLLETLFERRNGRTGPGAGRPAKLYFRSRQAVELSVPARDYAFLADLMARALESHGSGAESLERVAYASGRGSTAEPTTEANAAAPAEGDAERALAERGYEPYRSADGELRLRNCPFDRLAEAHRELVCSANLAFLRGVVDQLHLEKRLQPRLDPRAGECCVALSPWGNESASG